LSGDRSPLAAKRVIEKLGRSIPTAKTVVVAGAGHMGPLSHADAVNRAIVEALVGPTARSEGYKRT
jgi:pimeloyl-ACP methyl ester carboxylesterase